MSEQTLRFCGRKKDETHTFNKHQCYTEPGSTRQIFCGQCGGTELYVGQDHYYTVACCIKCKKEELLHGE